MPNTISELAPSVPTLSEKRIRFKKLRSEKFCPFKSDDLQLKCLPYTTSKSSIVVEELLLTMISQSNNALELPRRGIGFALGTRDL